MCDKGCSGCGGCNGCTDCDKPTELKYTSQIQYDGPVIDLPDIGLTIEPCENLNDIISKVANKINELHTP